MIRRHGLPEFVRSVRKEVTPQYSDYNAWIRARQLKKKQIISQRDEAAALAFRPKISIVIPLYNTPLNYLRDMVDSIQSQTYDNWQLCLADGSSQDAPGELLRRRYGKDQRIVYQKLKENGGISANTNEALKMADGDFILLADHDDLLVQGALFEIVKALNEHPETEIVYTDEDKISMNGRLFFGPNFKPDFSWDLLRSVNYICHIFVVKSEIVKKAGWFRSEYDGAQDYDFILRCCEQTEHIVHIPRVCITGGRIRIPLRRIRKASGMLMTQAEKRWRLTIREQAWRPPWRIRNITAFTGADLLSRVIRSFPF
mgnify:CR=1 FL=1